MENVVDRQSSGSVDAGDDDGVLSQEIRALQVVLHLIPPRLLAAPIELLELPVRAINALTLARIRNLRDLFALGAEGFASRKNVGVLSIKALRRALEAFLRDPRWRASNGAAFGEAADDAGGHRRRRREPAEDDENTVPEELPNVAPPTVEELWTDVLKATDSEGAFSTPNLKVITGRFGLLDGVPRTLEEIGRELGVTRERVRQRESVVIRRLRHRVRISFVRSGHLIRANVRAHHVAPISSVLIEHGGSNLDTSGFTRLVARICGDEFYVLAGRWIVSRNGLPERLLGQLRKVASEMPAEIPWRNVAAIVRELLGREVSEEAAVAIFFLGVGSVSIVRASDGTAVAVRQRPVDLAEAAYIILQQAGVPLNLGEIGRRALERFRRWASGRIGQKVYTAIQDDERFIQVGSGTYDLTSRFRILADQRKLILDSAIGVLRRLGRPTDTRFLLKKIRLEASISEEINSYVLYWLIRRDPRFQAPRRLHIGLLEWGRRVPSRPFAEALIGTLEEAERPLTEREVYRKLSDVQSPHLYGVSQSLDRLAKQGRILKVAPQTFAAFSTLGVPEELAKIIRESSIEHMAENGIPLVVRLFRGWLRERGGVFQDLSDPQVDFVLYKYAQLTRVGYGVYIPTPLADTWRRDPVEAHAAFILEGKRQPMRAAELLWTLEETHLLPSSRIWEKLLNADQIQHYPLGYIGLQEWGIKGWLEALGFAWDNVTAELVAYSELPRWVTPEAKGALLKLALAKGDDRILALLGKS